MANVPRRKNGLSRPYASGQISAWIALFATFIEFILVVSPLMPIAASVPVSIYFVFLVGCSFYYGFLTQVIDPVDQHLAQYLHEQESSRSLDNDNKNSCLSQLYNKFNPISEEPLPDEPMKHCWICDVQVAEHAMHCKFCNKCVGHFDHHCMWLNTCIGQGNYLHFFRTMIFLFLMEASHMIIQLVLLIDSFMGGPTKERTDNWFIAKDVDPAVHAILIFFIIFNAISIFLIGQLLWFHINLRKENLTTYLFIVKDHKKRREQLRLEAELQSKRRVAVSKAHDEGKFLYAMRLQCGGTCRSLGCGFCDPLDMPKPEPEADPEAGFASALGNAGDATTNSGEIHPLDRPETYDDVDDNDNEEHPEPPPEAPLDNGDQSAPVSPSSASEENGDNDNLGQRVENGQVENEEPGAAKPTNTLAEEASSKEAATKNPQLRDGEQDLPAKGSETNDEERQDLTEKESAAEEKTEGL